MADSSNTPVRWHLRTGGFLLFWSLSLVLFWGPLAQLITLALHDERYSYILAVPFISGSLIYLRRNGIFSHPSFSTALGVPFLLSGSALFAIVKWQLPAVTQRDGLSILIAAILLVWTAGFLAFYGRRAVVSALFPVCFLVLIVPLTPTILDRVVLALQQGSAETSFVLFKLIQMPVLRDGFKFLLPGVVIEIAEECSGIHSSMSLFIASILVGYVFLRSGWKRAFLSFLTVPIVIFKNAVRIVTISWLGVYVDGGFFHGRLHHQGGLPFSLLALAIMGAWLFVLRRTEARPRKNACPPSPCEVGA